MLTHENANILKLNKENLALKKVCFITFAMRIKIKQGRDA